MKQTIICEGCKTPFEHIIPWKPHQKTLKRFCDTCELARKKEYYHRKKAARIKNELI